MQNIGLLWAILHVSISVQINRKKSSEEKFYVKECLLSERTTVFIGALQIHQCPNMVSSALYYAWYYIKASNCESGKEEAVFLQRP